MTIVGDRGTLTLRSADDPHATEQSTWELELKTVDGNERRILDEHCEARIAICQFADAIAAGDADRSTASTWDVATRAMEVVDAVELSLEKNRTIDVHQQQLTERLAFRGVMSALGCGLLLIGFLALVLVTIFGGAEGEGRAKVLTSWPFILLAVLALFLVLQLVPLLVGKRPRQNQATDGDQRVDRAG
jgi:hypothetical protein